MRDTEAGRTVEEILTGELGISRRMIQRLTRTRGIRVNGRPAYLKRAVRPGDRVAARIEAPEAPTLQPVPMELSIVYEDADLLVVDKPAGMLVHPTSPAHRETLAHGVANHFRKRGIRARVRPVHRLDRDVSGLLVFAKSGFAHQRLDDQLRSGEMVREYLALVGGQVEEDRGTIDVPIAREPEHPTRRIAVPERGLPARTEFEVVERMPAATLLRVRLKTGRTHQIRVHLAHIGHPVIGDRAYGSHEGRRVALHAARLSFRQPRSGEPLDLHAPPPPDLQAVILTFRAEAEPSRETN